MLVRTPPTSSATGISESTRFSLPTVNKGNSLLQRCSPLEWARGGQGRICVPPRSRERNASMFTSSPEVISSASETAPLAHWAKTSTDRTAAGVHKGFSRSRAQHSDTMEAWAQKVDVASQATDKWRAMKNTVQAKIGQVRRHLDEARKTIGGKAEEVTQQATSLITRAGAQVPAPVAGRVNHLAQAVQQRPVSAAATVCTIFALLLLRRILHRAAR